ncbi:hypothetical protein [Streptomyces sp. I8-5]|uniref:hypothetical protein n=1 Tax=Streptomyces sp. I8-5 TaxID=3104277 RepID=UPI003869444F
MTDLETSQVEFNAAQTLAQKAQAAKLLTDAGYDPAYVLMVVGLPDVEGTE